MKNKFYFARYPQFNFIRWHPYSIDILPKGGSKAEGIKKMIERLGFDLKDVYAFGDGLNDIRNVKRSWNRCCDGEWRSRSERNLPILLQEMYRKMVYGMA